MVTKTPEAFLERKVQIANREIRKSKRQIAASERIFELMDALEEYMKNHASLEEFSVNIGSDNNGVSPDDSVWFKVLSDLAYYSENSHAKYESVPVDASVSPGIRVKYSYQTIIPGLFITDTRYPNHTSYDLVGNPHQTP